MIEAHGLTKSYGEKRAVDALTFTVQPGKVTGFLGPNGAGKSTTMRMIMGLDEPTAGSVTVNGKPYREHSRPMAEVGALLEARAVHTSRSAYNHLRALAATHASRTAGWTTSSRWWVCETLRVSEPGASPSAWGSGWVSPFRSPR